MNVKIIFIVFLFITFFGVVSCNNKEESKTELKKYVKIPDVNIDDIVNDVDEYKIKKKYDAIDKVFKNLQKRTGFNGTVLFAEKGRIIYEKAFGFRDLRFRRDSLKINDSFQLSSLSKMFTAEAIMMLKHQRLIDYDTDLRTYIPEFPYEGITIRMLLNHRSGLSRYESLADKYWPDRKKPFFNEDMIEYYVKYKPTPYSKPDKMFHYCNVNYALLASVVERVTGMSFENYMQSKIFAPLGMTESYIYAMRDDTLVPTYIEKGVQGYYIGRGRPRQAQNEYLNGVKGDKIMFSDVNDLYRFLIASQYGFLFPDSIQEESYIPGSPNYSKRKDNYGFGWRISAKHKGCIYHYGWWKGYRSFFLRDNIHDRTLIVLTNTDKGVSSYQLWKILNDNSIELSPASINIPYIEWSEELSFPMAEYNKRHSTVLL